HGLFHLADARRLSRRPHLGGDEELRTERELGRDVADDLLGLPVHGGRVYEAAAELDERAQHLLERRPLGGGRADVEGLPGAEADDRDGLAGGGNRARQGGGGGSRAPRSAGAFHRHARTGETKEAARVTPSQPKLRRRARSSNDASWPRP